MNTVPTLWSKHRAAYFFIATKDRVGTWREHPFAHNEVDEVDAFVRANADRNVYFCPHGFRQARRVKEAAVLPKLLWADLDGVDPRTLKDLSPTVAIVTSPHRYAALWVTDAVVTEELNRRLTYHVRADLGGWCLTKVLRMPRTWNFKYKPAVRAKVLWDDGPTYNVADLERRLPKLAPVRANGTHRRASSLDAVAIANKHALKGVLRHELLKGQPRVGVRSSVHWKLANQLHEHGVPAHEAFVLLRDTAWNKHDDDGRVWALIEKIWVSDDA